MLLFRLSFKCLPPLSGISPNSLAKSLELSSMLFSVVSASFELLSALSRQYAKYCFLWFALKLICSHFVRESQFLPGFLPGVIRTRFWPSSDFFSKLATRSTLFSPPFIDIGLQLSLTIWDWFDDDFYRL